MSKESKTPSRGVGFTSLLTLMLIAFKILGFIDWSWWWVVSPIVIGFVVEVAAKVTLKMLEDRNNNW
jgi:hypothetical protein